MAHGFFFYLTIFIQKNSMLFLYVSILIFISKTNLFERKQDQYLSCGLTVYVLGNVQDSSVYLCPSI